MFEKGVDTWVSAWVDKNEYIFFFNRTVKTHGLFILCAKIIQHLHLFSDDVIHKRMSFLCHINK